MNNCEQCHFKSECTEEQKAAENCKDFEAEEQEFRVDATLHFIADIWATSAEEAEQKFMDSIPEWEGELQDSTFKTEEQ